MKIYTDICSQKKSSEFTKSLRFWKKKILALSRKTGGFGKYWRFYKNQADLKTIGAFQKIRRIWKIMALSRKTGGFTKCWRHAENRRTIESRRVLKSSRLEKNQRDWKILAARLLFRLGGISAADFLLDWLKSSHSDPCRCVASLSCRPQVRTQPRLPCFYGRTLSHTVPAACTGPTCQNSRGSQNSRRPRKFSPIPVKSSKS